MGVVVFMHMVKNIELEMSSLMIGLVLKSCLKESVFPSAYLVSVSVCSLHFKSSDDNVTAFGMSEKNYLLPFNQNKKLKFEVINFDYFSFFDMTILKQLLFPEVLDDKIS